MTCIHIHWDTQSLKTSSVICLLCKHEPSQGPHCHFSEPWVLSYSVLLGETQFAWVLFNIVSSQTINDALWKYGQVFLLRIFQFNFCSKSSCKYPHTNSYNFTMTLILQDDHLTAGAWATCAQGGIDFLYSYDCNE